LNSFEPRFDVLPTAQREIWPLLAPCAEMGLVLYGGTAVALRFGHRQSIDFDFFTERDLNKGELKRIFLADSAATVLQDRFDTFTVLVPVPDGSVKLSFFGQISFGRVGSPDRTSDGVLIVASAVDLLANKLKVIHQRIEAKDYCDIATILRSGMPLEDGLAAASALFSPGFQPSEAVKNLTCFEGGDLHILPEADRRLLTNCSVRLRRVPVLPVISRSLS